MSLLLPFLLALIAALFASVGQAGGAGYVAVMGLFGFGASVIRPTALCLTALVAAIGVLRFYSLGLLKTRDWLGLALLGVPCSLLGGMVSLPGTAYRILLCLLLLAAAIQMLRMARLPPSSASEAGPPFLPALLAGGVIGFAAGITGIGGGIFVAPLMLWCKWAPPKRAAAAAQVNNLYTALAAIAGVAFTHPALPPQLPLWAAVAGAGGLLGAWIGAMHLPETAFRYILAAILVVSAVKLGLG